MANNNFDINTNEAFEGSDKVKGQLVSEIDIIREAMFMVNMFIGEPFRVGATLLQEIEANKNTKKH
ncbi:hypothetical protein [Arcticibacterium luteifluviistationis]|uniref:Uncharacterized protein n=1 Tax=Arcticibacterium luteifluviistationis TaxID=1784714 RepID=A0A2Z4GFC1_9BACT|nr:hypothetical protein [Arcticibacterium luteifluviistationis]AWW00080.1 hypothetical protein DJ013_18665 [Arcticibacterium luteifluviistationis]